MMEWEITEARIRLSALVTLMGLVSETRWVAFFGMRKSVARLKSGGKGRRRGPGLQYRG